MTLRSNNLKRLFKTLKMRRKKWMRMVSFQWVASNSLQFWRITYRLFKNNKSKIWTKFVAQFIKWIRNIKSIVQTRCKLLCQTLSPGPTQGLDWWRWLIISMKESQVPFQQLKVTWFKLVILPSKTQVLTSHQCSVSQLLKMPYLQVARQFQFHYPKWMCL